MSHVRRAVACIVTLTAALFAFALPVSTAAHAVPPTSTTTANGAVSWLVAQQQPDGGFELAQFPGFETRDAALAIAEGAQTGGTWSTTQALDALAAVEYQGDGPTPLNALDDYAATVTTAGAAAKTIVLSASPLGLDPAAFDAADDGDPVDLVGLLDSGCGANTATFGPAFSDTLYGILAKDLVCGAPPAAALGTVVDAQQANGGWNFIGDPAGTDLDIDTTALAVEGLVAGGATATDPSVQRALAFFAANQQASGAWQSFGSDDPNSTSLAILGITAAGFDVESPCWRNTVAPTATATAYASPTGWLGSQQFASPANDLGRVASPNDGFGVNTFATSQTVQGLLQSWLPIVRAPEQTCTLPVTPTVDTTTPVAGGSITVTGGGFMPSTELTVELHSTPVVLGTTTTDVYGNYQANVVIPADTPPGPHQLVVTGLGPDGQTRSVATDITVVAPDTVVSPETVVAPAAVSAAPRFTG
ncbi:MAG TPA: hypothetical protein VGN51_20950 [Acidimicrobiia bacterium]|jgi:hypothetical protein